MCNIAYLDTRQIDADRLIAEFATPEDRADAARHSRLRRRRQTLAARALLRAALAREAIAPVSPWLLVRSPLGYPNAATSGMVRRVVSLAHSAAIITCATAAAGTIGIDVERIDTDRPVLALARAAFGPAEITDVEGEGATAFYRIWTLREALAKASGQGFDLLVNGKDLVPRFAAAERRRIGDSEWDLASWTLAEGYALAVARQAMNGEPILPPRNIANRAPTTAEAE